MAKVQSDISKMFGRVCRRCKSTETAKDNKGREIWIKDQCKKCYNYVLHLKHNRLRIRIDNTARYAKPDSDPRLGTCERCKRAIHDPNSGITRTCLCICESGLDARTATIEEIIQAAHEYCLSCHSKVHHAAKRALQQRGFNF